MQGLVYIGDRLKNLRMRQALMQYELADRVGVSSDALNGTELSKAESQMSTPRKLTKALDVDPSELVGE
jgi:transcriptional regulator with XRE-family HTH domain